MNATADASITDAENKWLEQIDFTELAAELWVDAVRGVAVYSDGSLLPDPSREWLDDPEVVAVLPCLGLSDPVAVKVIQWWRESDSPIEDAREAIWYQLDECGCDSDSIRELGLRLVRARRERAASAQERP